MFKVATTPNFGFEDDIGYTASLINGLEGSIEVFHSFLSHEESSVWLLKIIAETSGVIPYIGAFDHKSLTLYQSQVLADVIENFKLLYPFYFNEQPEWASLLNYGLCEDE